MKKGLYFLYLAAITSVLAFSVITANACTNITLKAKDDSVMVARTLEFGPNLASRIMTTPRGKQFSSTTPNGKTGKTWQAKYGYLFLDFFGQGQALDGMNEKGLSFGYLYMPGFTQYPVLPQGQETNAVSYLLFGDWALGNFASVDEVKTAIKNIDVYAMPVNFGPFKNAILPMHAIITDNTGKSIVVEFLNGKTIVFDQGQGVLTNSPSYDWQLTNLKNFANLSPYSPDAINVGGIAFSGTGQGAGAVGLPGDYSPPSRFVKVSFMVNYAYPATDSASALNIAQHIINNVDIPDGLVRGDKGSVNTPADKTEWTVFKDLTHNVFYFKSYENTTLQSIQLNQLNFNNGAPQLVMPVASSQIIVNSTDKYISKPVE